MASSSDTYEITAFQRMLSACAGSIINSFAVTPFDVVRIRLQQQQLLSPSGAVAMPKNCCRTQTVFWLSPIDCSHPCATVESATLKLTGTWQGLKFIGLNEGITTLWRGVSLALFIAIPANMVYFAGYDHLKVNSPVAHFWPAANPLFAGALARTFAVITIAPIELVKTRLQAMPVSKENKKALVNLLGDTKRMVQHSGIGSLFKGLQLTLWRDVPFSAIYWLSYEYFKTRIATMNSRFQKTWYSSGDTGEKRSGNDVALVSFLSGSVSGTIAAICTNPFDVGKTRLQVSVDAAKDNCSNEPVEPRTGIKPGRNTLAGSSPSSLAAPQPHPPSQHPNMFRFLVDIAKNEGFSALYTGLTPRILKIAPSCAVMISSYEISKNYFYNRSIESSKEEDNGTQPIRVLNNNFNNSKFD